MKRRQIVASLIGIATVGILRLATAEQPPSLKPIPDKLVVLTFDDAVETQFAQAAPILKQYGFGATFFVVDRVPTWTAKLYMDWTQIKQLHEAGFEIGNHTREHYRCGPNMSVDKFNEQVAFIETKCQEHGISVPKSFCYPSYLFTRPAIDLLAKRGYWFARRGFSPELPSQGDGGIGFVYDPKTDHPLLIPTTAAAGPKCGYDELVRAVEMARDGKICVLTFHGVPDLEHPWAGTTPDVFRKLMKYLHDQHFTVIALRDLRDYIDPSARTDDPLSGIERRQQSLKE